jgi:glycosyltransferase involved in cell wall biosynthesis
VVAEGSTGLLFPPGDASGLGQAVVGLFQEPGLRLAMGRAGRERARQVFDLEKTMRTLEQIYHRTLAGLPRG